jgi:uncharacterized protein
VNVRTTICIFAKPPVAGQVKTRLASASDPHFAAAVAQALLEDTIDMALRVSEAQVVLSVTEPFELPQFAEVPQWRQPEGDLGVRVEASLQRALLHSPYAIALGADTPGLPSAVVEAAIDQLGHADSVLGPTEDGGYYFLGVKQCPPGLLGGIRWSHPTTLADTVQQLKNFGQSHALAEPWFDLDTMEDLLRAGSLLESGTISAPRLSLAISQYLRAGQVTA